MSVDHDRELVAWLQERVSADPRPLNQDLRWIFSPNPDGTTTFYLGVEDGRWMGWRMTPDDWAKVRAAGDRVVNRAQPRRRWWWRTTTKENQ